MSLYLYIDKVNKYILIGNWWSLHYVWANLEEVTIMCYMCLLYYVINFWTNFHDILGLNIIIAECA